MLLSCHHVISLVVHSGRGLTIRIHVLVAVVVVRVGPRWHVLVVAVVITTNTTTTTTWPLVIVHWPIVPRLLVPVTLMRRGL